MNWEDQGSSPLSQPHLGLPHQGRDSSSGFVQMRRSSALKCQHPRALACWVPGAWEGRSSEPPVAPGAGAGAGANSRAAKALVPGTVWGRRGGRSPASRAGSSLCLVPPLRAFPSLPRCQGHLHPGGHAQPGRCPRHTGPEEDVSFRPREPWRKGSIPGLGCNRPPWHSFVQGPASVPAPSRFPRCLENWGEAGSQSLPGAGSPAPWAGSEIPSHLCQSLPRPGPGGPPSGPQASRTCCPGLCLEPGTSLCSSFRSCKTAWKPALGNRSSVGFAFFPSPCGNTHVTRPGAPWWKRKEPAAH